MPVWILIAILAYLLFAFNGVVDKFLLTKRQGNPGVYAFYLGIGSLMILVLAPFGMHALPTDLVLLALAAGACFTFALYFFYSAIQQTSISRILPFEGGLVPLFSLILAYVAGIDRLTPVQLWAFLFLVGGAVLMEFKKTDSGWHPLGWRNAVIAAFFFGLSFVLTKFIYIHTEFLNGLIWTRLGLAVGAVFMLLLPETWQKVKEAPRKTSTSTKVLFYTAHAAAGLAGLLQNYAISIGSVVIVNALQGVQFLFVLVLSVFLSKSYPRIIKEEVTKGILMQKLVAVVLITGGLILLAI